jgi:hypothetical protein
MKDIGNALKLMFKLDVFASIPVGCSVLGLTR